MVSRNDVAKLAGVSSTSVSYYINNSGYVSNSAREKIQKAIDELSYTPNLIARSLKERDSKLFLFFCNEIRNPFYAELVYNATVAAQKVGYTIMFTSIIDDDDIIEKMCGYQLSGVFASNNRIKLEHINALAKRDIPIVLLRDKEWSNLDKRVIQIKVDFSNIMDEIISHLNKEGFNDIRYISSSKLYKKDCMDEKTNSFIRAIHEDDKKVIYNISSSYDAYKYIIENYNKMNMPEAFVCSNDAVAIGVMRGINELELSLSDIAVVGFDNSFNSQFTLPSLTTVDIGMSQIGELAINMLVENLNGKDVRDYVIKPQLIIRDSSTSHK